MYIYNIYLFIYVCIYVYVYLFIYIYIYIYISLLLRVDTERHTLINAYIVVPIITLHPNKKKTAVILKLMNYEPPTPTHPPPVPHFCSTRHLLYFLGGCTATLKLRVYSCAV